MNGDSGDSGEENAVIKSFFEKATEKPNYEKSKKERKKKGKKPKETKNDDNKIADVSLKKGDDEKKHKKMLPIFFWRD